MPKILLRETIIVTDSLTGKRCLQQKEDYLEVTPVFLHFTRKVNLPLIAKYGKLCANIPEEAEVGMVGIQAVYGYNIDLIKKSQNWNTLPPGVLEETDSFCCLVFSSDADLWVCTSAECETKYCPEIGCPLDCPLFEYEVVSVEQAFALANTDVKGVWQSKFESYKQTEQTNRFVEIYGEEALRIVMS